MEKKLNKYAKGGVVYSKDGYVKSIKDFNGKLIRNGSKWGNLPI